jgi:hypothetical protein
LERLILKKPPVQETALNELIYTLAYNLTNEQKINIPTYFLNKIKTAKRARKFASNSSTDQKREFLSYLPISSFFVIANIDRLTATNLKEILQKFKKEQPLGMLKEMIKQGFFVSSDKELIFLLGNAAQTITSPTYAMNMELERIGLHLRRWPTRIVSDIEKNTKENIKNKMAVVKSFRAARRYYNEADTHIGLTSNQTDILSFFYERQERYVDIKEVISEYVGQISNYKLIAAIKKLKDSLLLQKHIDWTKREFTITALGIRSVDRFTDKILLA